jgi:hypothetical protein
LPTVPVTGFADREVAFKIVVSVAANRINSHRAILAASPWGFCDPVHSLRYPFKRLLAKCWFNVAKFVAKLNVFIPVPETYPGGLGSVAKSVAKLKGVCAGSPSIRRVLRRPMRNIILSGLLFLPVFKKG